MIQRIKRWWLRVTQRWRVHDLWPVDLRKSEPGPNKLPFDTRLGKLVCLRCGETVRVTEGTSSTFDPYKAVGFNGWWSPGPFGGVTYEPVRGCRGYDSDRLTKEERMERWRNQSSEGDDA